MLPLSAEMTKVERVVLVPTRGAHYYLGGGTSLFLISENYRGTRRGEE